MRRRFFVEGFEGDRAVLAGDAAHHLGRVLRAEPGQLYELSDGTTVRLGKIEFSGRDRVEFSLLESIPVRVSSLDKTLLLAVVKFDAFEWAIEKATELGVNRIVPLAAARSEKGLLAAAAKRMERWKKIVFEASQQSRRVRLPVIEEVVKAETAFGGSGSGRGSSRFVMKRENEDPGSKSEPEAPSGRVKVMLSERAEARPLREVLSEGGTSVALAIGPEGGWTEEEFAAAAKAGFSEASLGSLILRTETAVTACLAAANYELER